MPNVEKLNFEPLRHFLAFRTEANHINWAMDGDGVSGSYLVLSQDKDESLYPMFFGVSCAFFALRILSEPKLSDEIWSEIRNGMLQGSAHLLGLLVWRAQKEAADDYKSQLLQKLEDAQRNVEELKKRRSEDAKANAKVVGIFAAQEQGWFNERKKLRQQIGGLINELRVLETKTDKAVSELNEKLQENEISLKSKDKIIEEEEQKRQDLEETLKSAEDTVAKFRETAKQETQRHSNEISKHKTAFIELVSNQRQLEAEMGRALRQFESAKQERDSVLEQKEQSALMAQKLSLELVKRRRDLEQKDQILSAMLRKSKLDTAEKQMLLEEVKMSKAQKKQAELEIGKFKTDSEPRRERHSLRSMLSKHANSKVDAFSRRKGVRSNEMMQSNMERPVSNQINCLLEYEQPEIREELKPFSPALDHYIPDEIQDLTDIKQLEIWVRSRAEKYITALEQRHQLEIDAFAEQLRVKDEKLEGFRWRLLSMELESKRLQSHIEDLESDLTKLRQDNMRLEALLLNREAELHSIKEKLASQVNHTSCQKTSSNPHHPHDLTLAYETIWSKVKIVKREPGEKEKETKAITQESYQKVENDKQEKTSAKNQHKDIVLTLQPPRGEIEEIGDALSPNSIQEECTSSQDVDKAEASQIAVKCLTNKNNPLWKMDLHALGVSYKIKRLKQQLLMLERLAGKQESLENSDSNGDDNLDPKGLYALLSLLNKQIGRYQSLQGKTDDLCQRMHENDIGVRGGTDSNIAKTKEEIRLLEHYLEETFQLQRYMVATGQKLMELQSKISSGFVSAADEFETPASFDMKRFADSIRTLFKEVQRGLEIRISRIIGDLEGTLACDGIIHLKK